LGRAIEPAIRPLGFDWKMGVSLISGITAKEVVISTLGVLFQSDENLPSAKGNLTEKIQNDRYSSGVRKNEKVFTPLATFSFLLFILIYFPCIAVFAAIKKESGSIWWAVFMIVYTTALAYLISFTVFQVGSLFT
jgi:ferrous iron transport protein B